LGERQCLVDEGPNAGRGLRADGIPSTSVARCTATPQARRKGLQVGSGPSGASAMVCTARHNSWRARAGERPRAWPICRKVRPGAPSRP
jgi:hypothetical protein